MVSEAESKRFFRYSLRRYESLGPGAIQVEINSLKARLISESSMTESDFWEIYQDLLETNNWSDSHILAYFETCLLENNT